MAITLLLVNSSSSRGTVGRRDVFGGTEHARQTRLLLLHFHILLFSLISFLGLLAHLTILARSVILGGLALRLLLPWHGCDRRRSCRSLVELSRADDSSGLGKLHRRAAKRA